ncbi:50S ribosomal protein L29 [archaeon]|nr:50S ribosomal protein L29 [archaeon]
MAILKMKKVRELQEKDLNEKLREMKMELSKDRGASEVGTVKNPGRIKEIRRTISRMMTEKRSRELKRGEKKE